MTQSFLFHRNIAPGEILPTLVPYDVHELYNIQDNAQNGGAAHDAEEDLLLRGFGDVAVHRVGTWTLAAA